MGRKLPPDFIKKEYLQTILETKGVKLAKNVSKNELALLAFRNNLIDRSQYIDSLIKKTSTIPCYLYTHIQDDEMLTTIEKYVQSYSILYTRGTWIANLACILLAQNINLPEDFPTSQNTIPIPTFLEDENLIKQAFLPERWLLKEKPINQSLYEAYNHFHNQLMAFLPDYNTVMSDCGWDNALNYMGKIYLGNVKVKICTHLVAKLETFIMDCYHSEPDTNKKSLWLTIKAPLSPNTMIHNADFEWAMNVRNCFNIKLTDWLYAPKELNDYVWTLHNWLVKKIQTNPDKSSSFLPISPLGRKFAYIDEKVAKSLFPAKVRNKVINITKNHTGSELQKILGLTRQLFNKRRLAVRKALKAKYKDNKKLKKKWSKIGHGCLPPEAKLKMITTDGVGLRLCIETVPKENEIIQSKDIEKKEIEKDDSMFMDLFKVGWDTGRARIVTSVDDDNKVTIISRSGYYWAQRDHLSKQFEKERMTDTPWGEALAKISSQGGLRNESPEKWTNTLNMMVEKKDILISEQINDKTRSRMAMRRLRWKKAFFDRKFKEILNKTIKNKQKTIIGIGDGDFACTGRGEQSVPTKKVEVLLKRFIQVHKIEDLVSIRKINEYNTTKHCHKCHKEMEKLATQYGKECLRYRLCTNCVKTGGKRRNRDVNAAKNIKMLLGCEVAGLPRPQAFTNPYKRKSI